MGRENTVVAGHADEVRINQVERAPVRSELDETKASLKTTELWAFAAAVIGVWLTTQRLDNVEAWDGLRLITALVIGYMVSRGLAKAGSRHSDDA
jgi:hypothetical protein